MRGENITVIRNLDERLIKRLKTVQRDKIRFGNAIRKLETNVFDGPKDSLCPKKRKISVEFPLYKFHHGYFYKLRPVFYYEYSTIRFHFPINFEKMEMVVKTSYRPLGIKKEINFYEISILKEFDRMVLRFLYPPKMERKNDEILFFCLYFSDSDWPDGCPFDFGSWFSLEDTITL